MSTYYVLSNVHGTRDRKLSPYSRDMHNPVDQASQVVHKDTTVWKGPQRYASGVLRA